MTPSHNDVTRATRPSLHRGSGFWAPGAASMDASVGMPELSVPLPPPLTHLCPLFDTRSHKSRAEKSAVSLHVPIFKERGEFGPDSSENRKV